MKYQSLINESEKLEKMKIARTASLNKTRQRLLLKQYDGKPLNDHNLKNIFDQMTKHKIAPSSEMARLFQSIGLEFPLSDFKRANTQV